MLWQIQESEKVWRGGHQAVGNGSAATVLRRWLRNGRRTAASECEASDLPVRVFVVKAGGEPVIGSAAADVSIVERAITAAGHVLIGGLACTVHRVAGSAADASALGVAGADFALRARIAPAVSQPGDVIAIEATTGDGHVRVHIDPLAPAPAGHRPIPPPLDGVCLSVAMPSPAGESVLRAALAAHAIAARGDVAGEVPLDRLSEALAALAGRADGVSRAIEVALLQAWLAATRAVASRDIAEIAAALSHIDRLLSEPRASLSARERALLAAHRAQLVLAAPAAGVCSEAQLDALECLLDQRDTSAALLEPALRALLDGLAADLAASLEDLA